MKASPGEINFEMSDVTNILNIIPECCEIIQLEFGTVGGWGWLRMAEDGWGQKLFQDL